MNLLKPFIYFSLLLAVFAASNSANGQLVAGTTPAGAIVTQPGIHMWGDTSGRDSAGIDLNCDGQDDLVAGLLFGSPALDFEHAVGFRLIHPALEVCVDSTMPTRPHGLMWMYDAGDTMACGTIPQRWSGDEYQDLGYLGCLCPPGPFEAVDRYVLYRLGNTEGWIQLSFDLDEPDTVTFSITEVVQFCGLLPVDDKVRTDISKVYPHPVHDRARIEIAQGVRASEVVVWNMLGTVVRRLRPEGLNRFEFDRGGLPAGMYVYQVNGHGGDILGSGKLTVSSRQ